MRIRTSALLATLLLCGLAAGGGQEDAAGGDAAGGDVARGDGITPAAQAFLDAHCIACHGPDVQRAMLRLDGGHVDGPGRDGLMWEELRSRVAFGEMPPPGEPAPDDADRADFLEWLDGSLGIEEPTAAPPAPLRRLTRAQWKHAALDLFGVPFDPESILPEDAVGHGFDHVAEAQTMSEAHFVRYLDASEAVAERAIPFDDGSPPPTRRFEPGMLDGANVWGGTAWLTSRGVVHSPAGVPRAGEYVVRAAVYGQQAGPDPCRARLVLGGIGSDEIFEVEAANKSEAQVISARLTADGPSVLGGGVSFLNDYYRPNAPEGEAKDRNLGVLWIEVEGPFGAVEPTPFAARWTGRARKGQSGLRRAIKDLAGLVWRQERGASAEDVRRLLSLSHRDDPVVLRLRAALTGMLASPRFLFAVEERPAPGKTRDLGGAERATRLAALIWNSVPDEALLGRARKGRLNSAKGVVKVAREMLEDPRADRFIESFGRQWLQLDGLHERRADRKRFPDFDAQLLESMVAQTRLVMRQSLREERSLWDLVEGTTTLVDQRLAMHYGLDFDAGEPVLDGWARVDLAKTQRRGLLGHGSILYLTSEPERTSPVKRGKWVLDVLLGTAPPPPPPGVDSLPEEVEGEDAGLSLRERFELHRTSPDCASCHARMDPIGFGLEAFDAIGAVDPEADASGELPDGRSFDGPAELASILRGEGRFLEALVERLLVYSLGRAPLAQDRAVAAAIVASLDQDHPTLQSALLAIVASDAFLTCSLP